MASRVSCCTISGMILISLSLILVVIASALPYWQETKSTLDTGVPRIGLWEICFSEEGFAAPLSAKDVSGNRYYGCNYVFDRDLKYIIDWIFPDWFIAVAVLVTLGLLFLPIALIISVLFILRICSPHREHLLLMSSSSLSFVNGILTAIAIIVFGMKAGKDRHWVAAPETNHLSYSFAVCAFVPVFCFFASMCYTTDFLRIRSEKLLNSRAKVYAKGEFNNRF